MSLPSRIGNFLRLLVGSTTIRSGTGDPNGTVAGIIGDMWHRTDGGPGTAVYIKESNTGSSGWTPVDVSASGGGGISELTGDVTAGPGSGPQAATIPAGTIDATRLAANAVVTVKILDANVTTAKIADANVTTAKIADANITTVKIADANITTAKIADGNVTLAKLANVAAARVIGRASGAGTGAPAALTASDLQTIIGDVVGDTGTGGAHGLVPAPAAGDAAAGKYLKADGTFAVPPGSGSGINQLTGDVTAGPGTGSQAASIASNAVVTAKIADDNVTNAKLANMAQSTIKGRAAGAGTGDPTDLTATQATAILDAVVGDSGSGGTKGLVPAPASGDASAGKFLKADGTWAAPPSGGTRTTAITVTIDGGGSVITTGIKCDVSCPVACTITEVKMLADVSGSIVVDVWKDSYANYPPTVADTIVASAKPTISSATKSQDTTLTGWTTSISAGDTLRFNVDSVTSIKRLVLVLKITI